MWYSFICVVSDASNNARVAQWWSVSLPRRRSRVRSPSRAYFFCKNIGPVCNLHCMSFCGQDLCFCKERCKHLSNLLFHKRFGSQAPKVAFGRFDGKKVHRTFFLYRLTPSRAYLCPKTWTFRYLKVDHCGSLDIRPCGLRHGVSVGGTLCLGLFFVQMDVQVIR